MIGKFVNDWLEEGYTNLTDVKNGIRRENALVPIFTNDKGNIQTPKPLFPSFLLEVQLEPDFLPKYLTNFENKFCQIKTFNLEDHISKEMPDESPSAEVSIDNRIFIEYDRKSIFLSRVMFNLFEIPDSSVPKGSSDYPKVVEKNQLYENALERHKKFPEEFEEKYIQTDFIDLEEKQIGTIPMIFEDKSCMINNYLVKEHYNRSEMKVKTPPKLFQEFFDAKTKFTDYTRFLASINSQQEFLERVSNALYVIEKTLDYNTYKNSILKYNGYKTDIANVMFSKGTDDSEKKEFNDETSRQDREEPKDNSVDILHHLGFYFKELKSNFEITCLECSPFNPNIFVAGYGVSKYKEMDSEYRGMVLCWNIHKCGYPEKIYKTEEIVTSLEFSKSAPFLVAVGMRYGLISLFYLNNSETGNLKNNFSSKIIPTGAIKKIRWLKKEYVTGKYIDMLLTVSIDGLLCSWICGKDIVGNIFRYIKRGGSISDQERRLVVAIDAAGMCMEFKPDNNEIFLIGTIEGEVLQANINDSDHYKCVYKCHNGPVYDLQWSPLVADVFITTGSDRNIHIWQVGKKKPSKSLTLDEVVLKVAWSCVKSTLFTAMCKKKILVFDLSIDLHKAVTEYEANALSFTFLSFCPRNNWFLVGQSNGYIELHELKNVSDLEVEQEEALKKTFLSQN